MSIIAGEPRDKKIMKWGRRAG